MCCELQRIISLRGRSPRRSGGGAGKGRRACNLNSTSNSIPLWLPIDWAVRFLPISAKRKRAQILTNSEKHVPTIMTSLLTSSSQISISHRFFQLPDQVHVHVVASSLSSSRPAARAPQRACSQARDYRLSDWLTLSIPSISSSSISSCPSVSIANITRKRPSLPFKRATEHNNQTQSTNSSKTKRDPMLTDQNRSKKGN